MQWIFNIIKEWVLAQGYLTTSFVDRGDPVSPDWDKTSLTQDGNWHNLDLSPIVPPGAKAVLLQAQLTHVGVGRGFKIRRDGNTKAVNISIIYTQVAMISTYADWTCPVPESRIIEYWLNNVVFTNVYLSVKGWWL